MTSQNDDDLRALLDETAEQITPHGSLEDILARTERPTRRHWALPVLGAAAVMALVVGGIGWMNRDNGPSSVLPATSPTGTATGTAGATKESEVYYLGDTATEPRLFGEMREVHSTDGTTAGFGMDAANAAVSGSPTDPDYRSAWPDGTEVTGMSACTGGTECEIQVNFGSRSVEDRPEGMTDHVAALSVEQLIRTVQAAENARGRVFFTADTASGTVRLDRVLGVNTSAGIGTRPDDDVMAPVQIISPTNGETVPAGQLQVSGLAATFEANVVWEVLSTTGAVVKQDFTTAAECCTLSPYSFTVDLQPGTYTIVVHDSDESGEGRAVNQDTKEIVVE